MLAALEADGCWPIPRCACSPATSPRRRASSPRPQAIARIKAAKPGIAVLVDPVIGDAGRLYVAQATAEAIRDALLPLATIATPNLFELSWLTGALSSHPAEVVQARARVSARPRSWSPRRRETAAAVATLLVGKRSASSATAPRRAGIPNGAGDLFAGLFLGQCSTAAPARRRSTPASPTSIACWRRAPVATCCSWRPCTQPETFETFASPTGQGSAAACVDVTGLSDLKPPSGCG